MTKSRDLRIQRTSMALGCVVLVVCFAQAQESGVPFDNVPDIYYFADVGATAMTSLGPVGRPQGTLLVDTDGTDMVAILVGGADVFTGCTGRTGLCNNGLLPDPNAPPSFASSWTQGFINGVTQWVRTSPLNTDGFVGVIGEYDDPSGLFPTEGLANYGPAAAFDAVFDDGTGAMWEVTYATNVSGAIWTNVTLAPIGPNGDFNGDGSYDCLDVDALVSEIAFGSGNLVFDLTFDSIVDGEDLALWRSLAGEANLGPGLSYLPADSTLDGFVDGSDFISWSVNKFGPGGAWCDADFNADGVVDGTDFMIWNDHKFTSSGALSSVPEPDVLALAIVGAFTLVFPIRSRVFPINSTVADTAP